MRAWLFLLLAVFSPTGFTCSAAPRDLSWAEMLTASQGAVVVRASKVELLPSGLAVFELENAEVIADPRLLARGRTVLGVEAPFAEKNWHDRVAFWAGQPAGGVRNGTCRFFQRIDPDVPHLMLLGVDGPYALEPIAPRGDRWLEAVREYYRTSPVRAVPTIRLPDTLTQIKVMKTRECPFENTGRTIENFLTCIRHEERHKDRILVSLRVADRHPINVTASGEGPSMTRQELIREFKTDFGWPDVVSLRSLLDGSALPHGR